MPHQVRGQGEKPQRKPAHVHLPALLRPAENDLNRVTAPTVGKQQVGEGAVAQVHHQPVKGLRTDPLQIAVHVGHGRQQIRPQLACIGNLLLGCGNARADSRQHQLPLPGKAAV
ncbi:hypothetical protein D3C87_1904020 [compost metagenome]